MTVQQVRDGLLVVNWRAHYDPGAAVAYKWRGNRGL